MPINIDPSQLEPIGPQIDPSQLEPVQPIKLQPLDKARAAKEALQEPLIDPVDVGTHMGLGIASVLREPAEASAEEVAERAAGGLARTLLRDTAKKLAKESVKSALLAAGGSAGISTARQSGEGGQPEPQRTQPQATLKPSYDPRLVEQYESGGLQAPTIDPVDLLTFGGIGALESIPESVGAGLTRAGLNALRQGAGSAAAIGLMSKGSELAAPAIAQIPGRGPLGQVTRGVASQAAGMAPILAAGILPNLRLRARVAKPYELPEAETATEATETPSGRSASTNVAPAPESQPAPAPVSGASAPASIEVAPEQLEPVRSKSGAEIARDVTPPQVRSLEDNPGLERVNDFPVDRIATDPESFQYKRGFEKKTGAGLALRNVRKWDPGLAGRLTLYRDADGTYYVVNGHQRLAAMKRLGIPAADVQIIDHSQMTKPQAKAYGFRINFAEGRGTAMDAASYMRLSGESPDKLLNEGVFDLSESKQRDAIGLYNLAPALWRAVENKTLSERRGAMIGNELGDNPAAQESLLKSLRSMEASKQGITDEKLQARIKFTKGAATGKETQTDLFGTREQERSLVDEQADVYLYVRDRLAKDRRLFGAAAANEGRLAEGGTQVDVEQAQGIESAAARRLAVLDKFGTHRGFETNEAFRKFARLYRDTDPEQRPQLLKQAYGEIFNALNRDYRNNLHQDLAAVTSRFGARGPSAEEPATGPVQTAPEGEAGEPAPASAAELEAAGQGSMFAPAPKPAASQGKGYTELGGSFLPGAREFITQDVIPTAQNAAALLRNSKQSIQKIFAPHSVSEGSEFAAGKLTKWTGEMEAAHERAAKALNTSRRFMDGLSDQQKIDFIDRMERGQVQPNLELQQVAEALRKLLDDQRTEVQRLGKALGKPLLQSFIQDYFPHIWKDPAKAEQVYNGFGAKGSLEGGKSFLKHRTFDYYVEGLKAGLEPVTTNPVDLVLLKHYEMGKFLRGQRVFKDLRDSGYAQFVRFGERPPESYAKLNDKIARVFQYSDEAKGFIARGEYYVPEPVARVINNYLEPGLRGNAIYDALRAGSIAANRFQLGLSAFHLGVTSVNSATSDVALGIMKLARGEPAGFKYIGRGLSGLSIVTDVLRGRKGYREFYNPGSIGSREANLVQAYIEAGGKIGIDPQYSGQWAKSFADAAAKGNVPGALIRLPGAAIETLARPLFDYIIPRAKLGAFMELAQDELSRLPGGGVLTDENDRMAAIQRAQRSIDNRFGMINYDNLHWSNAWKDAAFLLMRAPGWNIGTARELGGALVDLAARRGMTPKVAYAMSLPLVAMVWGAAYQYFKTGELPEFDPKDLRQSYINFTKPKTGRLLPNGAPERVQFPSYLKDVEGMYEHPGKTVGDKLNPLIEDFYRLYQNQNYNREEIRHPGDPLLQQGLSVAGFLGHENLPFTVQDYMRRRETSITGAPAGQGIESFLGIKQAPREFTNSPAQALMQQFEEQNIPAGARTTEQIEHTQLKRQLLQQFRAGQKDVLREAVEAGKITKREAHEIGLESAEKPFVTQFKRLTIPQAVEVYRVANESEKKAAYPLLAHKFRHIRDVPGEQREYLIEQLKSIELEHLRRKKEEEKRAAAHTPRP